MLLHIIENNLADITLYRELLEEIDPSIQLLVSENGHQALESLTNSSTESLPNGVLLDLNMPVMNGIEFLKVFREWNANLEIPVIILTSSEAPIDIKKSYENNCTAFFTKPFEAEETKELMELIIDFLKIRSR
ncbi:response regulator [Mongoliitalea lutea]|uniref:Response regulator n=1 Tax=Mongoliitalea lutea TaxID=849756 RepID=A0A8J3CXH2_9BACT|nr:response regulator [Mongoliitalea lutea]GHB35371.1 response regulator [Mongoliitalea lutea]